MMTSWMPELRGRSGPKYIQIADAIAEAIHEGDLDTEAKLPAMRNLAYDLGVTLGTVSRAYQEAERRGLVGGEVGRGTYVKSDGRYPQPRAPRAFALGGVRDNGINLSMAVPPLGDGGSALAETIREISKDGDMCGDLMDYQGHSGLARHRYAGVQWVARADVDTDIECLTITNGTQHGLLISMMALTRPGDTVLVENITYPGIIHIASQLGVRLAPVEIDHHGMKADALEEAILEHRPSAVYLVPTVQNPTAVIMPMARRQAIAEVVQRHRVLVIEDDIWAFLPDQQMTAIAALIPDQVVYVTGLSKAMAPGLRVGYVAAPPGANDAIRATSRMSGWMTPPLMAEVAMRWLDDGTGEKLMAWQRNEAKARMKIAADALAGHDIYGHEHSYQIWLTLPDPWRGETVRQQAEARGVFLLSGESFVVGRQPAPHAIRICIGSCRTQGELEQGMTIIRDILNGPGGAAPVIA